MVQEDYCNVGQKQKEDCCGCSACKNVCPKSAITMTPDVLGFMYPIVSVDSCVDCGLCLKVCAFHEQKPSEEIKKVFAARSRNEEDLLLSQSGGMFAILAEFVIEQGALYMA